MKFRPQLIVGGNCSIEKSQDRFSESGRAAHWWPERNVTGLFVTTFVPISWSSLSMNIVSYIWPVTLTLVEESIAMVPEGR